MKHLLILFLLLLTLPPLSKSDKLPEGTFRAGRFSTMSIIARDPRTGELGVAVESHYFSVGPVVPWAEAGVGAVATQANAEPSYGPLGGWRLFWGTNDAQSG